MIEEVLKLLSEKLTLVNIPKTIEDSYGSTHHYESFSEVSGREETITVWS